MPHHADHLVHLYDDATDLAPIVARFLAVGVDRGDAGIVIAEPAHRRLFTAELERLAVDLDRIVLLDASACVDRFVLNGQVDAAAFDAAVGAQVRDAATGGGVAAYGEMVALLWRDGLVSAAIELEELWNGLGATVPLSLLCAYPAGDATSAAFADVCRAHGGIHEQAFAHELAAPAAARHFVMETLRCWGRHDVVDDAALIVTELATNAVAHTGSGFTVSLNRAGESVRVAVADASPAAPRPRLATPTAQRGRGLLLVEVLTDEWGADVGVDGKVVWATLAS